MLEFEKKQWEWNESYKIRKLGGSDSREVSPLVVWFKKKKCIAYVYSPEVKKGMHYLAEKMIKKEEQRRKLFVKIHGILKNVPSQLILRMAGRTTVTSVKVIDSGSIFRTGGKIADSGLLFGMGGNIAVFSNAKKYGADAIIREGKPIDYLLGEYGTSVHDMLKKYCDNMEVRGLILTGLGVFLGRLCALGYKPLRIYLREFIIPDWRNPLEVRLSDIFDLHTSDTRKRCGISLQPISKRYVRQMQNGTLVVDTLRAEDFPENQIPHAEIVESFLIGFEDGYKEFSA